MTRVAIVVPAYNAGTTLNLTLPAVLGQQPPAASVVVVDDGSTDRTPEVIASYSGVTSVRQENGGPARARNTGWSRTQAEFVLFTDSDCVPERHWAARLVEGFSDERIGAVTGSYSIANPEFLLPRLIHEEIKDRHRAYSKTVKFFGSYNVALRRRVLEEVGGFDETYRRASAEDNDLSYRVLKAGYTIAFNPDALVAHHHTRFLGKYLREQRTHGYWRMKLYRAHPDMAGGDDYTRAKDIVEPPLAMLCIASTVTLPWTPWLAVLVVGGLFVLQVPAAVRIAVSRRDVTCLALAPVTFLRAFARGLGMTGGLIRFFLTNGRTPGRP